MTESNLPDKLYITYETFLCWQQDFVMHLADVALKEVLHLHPHFSYARMYCVPNGKFIQLEVINEHGTKIDLYFWKDWQDDEPEGWYVSKRKPNGEG